MNLLSHLVDLVVSLPDPDKLALHPVLELIIHEQELRVVQVVTLLKISIHKCLLVLLTHRVIIVFLQEDLTFSLELLEVVEKRGVHLLNTINDNRNVDIVRTRPLLNQQINIVSYPLQSTF